MIEGYKESSLGKIPVSWNIKSIGEVSTVIKGSTPRPKSDARYYGGNIPLLVNADVSRDSKYVTPKIDFLTEEGAQLSRLLQAGTLVMNCSENVGVSSILAVDACINDNFWAFTEIDKECLTDYLYYCFEFFRENISQLDIRSGSVSLPITFIKNFLIPIPPLYEQQKIAELLSTLDERIDILEKQISARKQLKKGLIQKLLTQGIKHTKFKQTFIGEIPQSWDLVTLNELRDITDRHSLTSGPFRSDLKAEHFLDEGIRVIQLEDIGEGKLLNKSEKFVAESKADELKDSNIFPGEIILTQKSPSTRSCIIPDNYSRYVMCPDSVRLSLDRKRFNPHFVLYALNTAYFKYETETKSIGASRSIINLNELKETQIAVGPLSEQESIAELLITVDDRIELIIMKKGHTEQLKKALMQQLLTGKIRTKNV